MDWTRVSPAHPCRVCGKPDWCTFAGHDSACCMRVQSDRPARNGGWFHGGQPTRQAAPPPRQTPPPYDPPAFDADRWHKAAWRVWDKAKLVGWADKLGLTPDSLDHIGATVLGPNIQFPMYDGTGGICGIRTRTPDGQKRAVTGSRAGVFLPMFHCADLDPVVCEGPTDAAAAEALGYEPIGRPSCAGCERHVADTARRWGARRVTICADADGPGLAGARRLADVLRAARIQIRLVAPGGHKDLRDWYKAGARRSVVDAAWSQAEWR